VGSEMCIRDRKKTMWLYNLAGRNSDINFAASFEVRVQFFPFQYKAKD